MFKEEQIKIGLDLGSSRIKAVKLRKVDESLILDNFEVQLNTGDPKEIINSLITKFNIAKKKVNISVSGPRVILRYLTLTKMSEEELKSSVRFEAAKHIPFPIDQLDIDSNIMRELDSSRMLVLVAAAKKDFVESKIKLIEDAGLSIDVIDVDSLAFINMFNYLNAKNKIAEAIKTFALVNLGASMTSLSIIEGGIPTFNREILLGGNDFTRKISDHLNINLKEAEDLKCNPANRLAEVKDASELTLTKLVSEIRSSFDYYESQNNLSVEKIVFSGGASMLEGLKNYFSEILSIGVLDCDLTAAFLPGPNLDLTLLKKQSSMLGVALGLALR